MIRRDSVRLLARRRTEIYSRVGEYLVHWWFGPRTNGLWAVGRGTWWHQPGVAIRPMANARKVGEMPEKPKIDASGTPQLPGASYGKWAEALGTLAAWLCDASYTDGTPCGKVRVSLMREGTEVRAVLQIQDLGGLRCEVSEGDPARALLALNAVLKSDKVPWQQDQYAIGNKPNNKPRK